MESRYKNLEMGDLAQEVKKNHEELNACSHHDFSIDLTPNQGYSKKWKCTACGGEVDARAKYWYEMGVNHQNEGQ